MIVPAPRAAPAAVPAAASVPLAEPAALAAVGTADRPRPHWPGRQVEIEGGTTLHVRETPGPDGGETAVFVHGLGGSSTNWTEIAGALSSRWHGVAPDLPGFGRSAPPSARDYGVEAHAGAITALLAELAAAGRGPVHLLGNSLGGAVALVAAAARPDLVRTLTLVSPAMPDLRPAPSRLGDARMIASAVPVLGARARAALAAEDPSCRLARTMRLCWADPAEISPAAFALAAGEAAERTRMPWAAEALHRSFVGLVRTWLAPARRSLWSTAARVPVPTLVVWGERDLLVSVRRARRTTAALPAGRLLRLPDVGHVAQMERPALVARAVLGLADAAADGSWTEPRARAAAPRTPLARVRRAVASTPVPGSRYGTVPV